MAGLKKLPIGIENFEEIRQEDFYYVDMWTLHESYTKDHFAPFGARPSSFQKNHQFP